MHEPNTVWTVDFKGHFRLGNREWCYPLTIQDLYSRYALECRALRTTATEPTRKTLLNTFRTYGLPERIRSDNGAPFAARGLLGLSQLSIWLLKLGLQIERTAPGQPQQNGRHPPPHPDSARDSADTAIGSYDQWAGTQIRALQAQNSSVPTGMRFAPGLRWTGGPGPEYSLVIRLHGGPRARKHSVWRSGMRFKVFSLSFLLLVPAATVAQDRDLEVLRDSLSQTANVKELRQRESALNKGPQAKTPDALMQRGLVLLRIFELTKQNGAGDDARDAFEKAVDLAPKSGWAHYGYGLALAGGPGVRVPTPGGVLDGFVLGQSLSEAIKQDPLSRSARQFVKALELAPALAPAAVELARVSLEMRHKDHMKRSRDALTKMVDGGNSDPDVRVALAQVQTALGDVAAAETVVGDHASAGALLAKAEALLRQPGRAAAGAAAYFEGAALIDAESDDAFFEQIRMIATDRELVEWQSHTLEARRAFLQHFWDLRAAASGKTVADRLAEHYTRLAEAQERFRRQGKRGGSPAGSMLAQKYDAEQLPFDERGLIFVRHGEPLQVIRTSNSELRPNESWVYQLPNGRNQMYHFLVLRDGADYRLVDDVLMALDPSAQELPYDGIEALLGQRGAYDARYNIIAARFDQIKNNKWAASVANVQCLAQGGTNCLGSNSAAGGMIGGVNSTLQTIATTRLSLANENREAALAALATDTDRPEFREALPFYYDVYTFKGGGQNTDLTAAIAIPGPSLEPRQAGGELVYSVQLSLIVIDTATNHVVRTDTTYSFRSDRRLGLGEHVRLHTSLATASSKTTIHRLVIRDLGKPSRGQMYGGGTTVPSYLSAGLMISDIVLAEPNDGTWERGAAKLALVPPRQFLESRPLTLFYELYNLPAATPYRTEISLAPTDKSGGLGNIKRLFGGKDGTMRLSFEGSARVDAAGRVQETRRVTTELKPGRYRVIVKVTNLQNQQVTTMEKQFVVIEHKERKK